MPPAMERRDTKFDPMVLPETLERDMLPHQSEILRPEVPVSKAEECGVVGRPEGGLAVPALEPLGPGVRLAPLHQVGMAAVETFRSDNRSSPFGETGLQGLLLEEGRDEFLKINNF